MVILDADVKMIEFHTCATELRYSGLATALEITLRITMQQVSVEKGYKLVPQCALLDEVGGTWSTNGLSAQGSTFNHSSSQIKCLATCGGVWYTAFWIRAADPNTSAANSSAATTTATEGTLEDANSTTALTQASKSPPATTTSEDPDDMPIPAIVLICVGAVVPASGLGFITWYARCRRRRASERRDEENPN